MKSRAKHPFRFYRYTGILLGLCMAVGSVAVVAEEHNQQKSETDSVDRMSVVALDDTLAMAEALPRSGSPSAVPAETENSNRLPSNMSISGFLDIAGSYQKSAADRSNLFLHEAELDVVAAQSDRVSVALSASYNTADENVSVCLATLGLQAYRASHGIVTDATLTAGLFNPRFGIDYQCNASPTRKLAIAPLVVQLTHQSWEDIGAEIEITGPHANLAAFAVNGFEPSEEVMQDVINLVTGLGDTVDVTPANAFGGRLGIVPFEGLEFGGSLAAGFNQSDENEMLMYGADFRLTRSIFDLRGEYILHSINRTIRQQDNHGFYIQPTVIVGRVYGTFRYDSFLAEGHPEATQLSVGAGYAITPGVEVRVESMFASEHADNQTVLQLFTTF